MNRGDYYRYVDELSERVSSRSDNNSQRDATASVTTVITLSRDMKWASAKDRTRGGYYLNWIWSEDIISSIMVSSHLRSVACRQKETGSYYYMKLDDYDMVTLCSSTESRIGERRLLFELDLDGRYYNEILWFLPARDRWLADRRRREVTTT
jgi:hypothetical protein